MIKKELQKLNDKTLWALQGDICECLNRHPYKENEDNTLFCIWYEVFKDVQAVIDERLSKEG